MALFSCKMCGGTLEITNETVAVCEYCGTRQTLPRLDDDRRTNLYDRANHFRRNNEFDKAMGIYEQILNDDGNDCEAYWSLVLCRYGIEYVEDPATHKRIPTVNRAQFTSVFDDDNYKSAIKNADAVQRAIYEEEARNINEIQKGILAISEKEEPFDVFICYKETDNNGRRTLDSVLAAELYHQLVRDGFKVFYSRITLEDKLGSAYEPHIFAALNSAKVMVVIGTKPEHFKAVWVRNEWSRYLSLIKQGQRKMLIPAYKDMDPYDLPEEFSHLQAQDMSKLGFMQDLIHGISKIVKAEKQVAAVQATAIPGITPLLKRAFMFLEDGDWSSANEYCEKVLDADPECAQAYLGKLMAELRVKKQELLVNQVEPFDSRNHYLKAIRFGDEELRNALNGYIDQIKARKENSRLYSIYKDAKEKMAAARSQRQCIDAANLFESISDYSDAAVLAVQCREKAEIIANNIAYDQAYNLMHSSNVSVGTCERAIHLFEQIPDWKDSRQQIGLCRKKIEELKEKAEADRLEKLRQRELEYKEQEEFQKRFKKLAIISALLIVVILSALILLNYVIIPNSRYNRAVKLMEAGDYQNAIFAFQVLDGYRDSDEKIQECLEALENAQQNDENDIMQDIYDDAK